MTSNASIYGQELINPDSEISEDDVLHRHLTALEQRESDAARKSYIRKLIAAELGIEAEMVRPGVVAFFKGGYEDLSKAGPVGSEEIQALVEVCARLQRSREQTTQEWINKFISELVSPCQPPNFLDTLFSSRVVANWDCKHWA